MINNVNNLTKALTDAASKGASQATPQSSTSFADVLKSHIDEVSQLQQDASSAVQNLTTGKADDVTGVFVAMEKSETAFKTLLAIRSKLLDAYEEIKNMPI